MDVFGDFAPTGTCPFSKRSLLVGLKFDIDGHDGSRFGSFLHTIHLSTKPRRSSNRAGTSTGLDSYFDQAIGLLGLSSGHPELDSPRRHLSIFLLAREARRPRGC